MATSTLDAGAFIDETRTYFRSNRGELARTLVSAMGLSARIPIPLIERWAQLIAGDHKIENFRLEVLPPGLRAHVRVNAMGTLLDAVADVVIERVRLRPDALRVRVRIDEVEVKPFGKARAPVAAILASDAFDFRQVGALASWAPERHPALVEATGNILELELLRIPQLAGEPRLKKLLDSVTPFCGVSRVLTTADAVHLRLEPMPLGIGRAARAALGRT